MGTHTHMRTHHATPTTPTGQTPTTRTRTILTTTPQPGGKEQETRTPSGRQPEPTTGANKQGKHTREESRRRPHCRRGASFGRRHARPKVCKGRHAAHHRAGMTSGCRQPTPARTPTLRAPPPPHGALAARARTPCAPTTARGPPRPKRDSPETPRVGSPHHERKMAPRSMGPRRWANTSPHFPRHQENCVCPRDTHTHLWRPGHRNLRDHGPPANSATQLRRSRTRPGTGELQATSTRCCDVPAVRARTPTAPSMRAWRMRRTHEERAFDHASVCVLHALVRFR